MGNARVLETKAALILCEEGELLDDMQSNTFQTIINVLREDRKEKQFAPAQKIGSPPIISSEARTGQVVSGTISFKLRRHAPLGCGS